MIDPALGQIPIERIETGRQAILSRTLSGSSAARMATPNADWTERGPVSMGGRMRCLLFDPNDPSGKKAWAGSLGGGLWMNPDLTNESSDWQLVSDAWQSLSVSSVAYDPTNTQIMYAGTGDAFSLPVGLGGAGIYKTTDGGQTWNRLASTAPGGLAPGLSRAFQYIERLVVNQQGHLFAATHLGVIRSVDGGLTWAFVLAPSQQLGTTGNPPPQAMDLVTDLEIGTDGVLYAAFRNGAVYRSTNQPATQWLQIMAASSSREGRVELGLASSTIGNQQVIYASMAAYTGFAGIIAGSNDALWVRKSLDAGASWTDLPIPAYTNEFGQSDLYTQAKGWHCLSLWVHPQNPQIVYLGSGKLARSDNGGLDWSMNIGFTLQNDNGRESNFGYLNTNGLVSRPGHSDQLYSVGDLGVSKLVEWLPGSFNVVMRQLNKGLRVTETDHISWANIADHPVILGSRYQHFAFRLPTYGLGIAQPTGWHGLGGFTVMDPVDPTLQIVSHNTDQLNLPDWDNNTLLLSEGIQKTPISLVGYDTTRSILYVAGGAGLGQAATPTLTLYSISNLRNEVSDVRRFSPSPLPGSPTAYRLHTDGSQFVYGTLDGHLYRVSGLQSQSLVIQAIDNGQLPASGWVSSVIWGQTANELLVTLSSFGIQSVWYTNNGGTTWTSKDKPADGLPDMPIRDALFNPANPKQVILATELGIWTTDDITATSPGWYPVAGNLPLIRCNQLLYRSSDGLVAVATHGRGIFTAPLWANSRPLVINAPTITGKVCAGRSVPVLFTVAGTFPSGNKFSVQLSDSQGNFSNPILTSPSTPGSSLSLSIPADIPASTAYRLRIVASDPALTSLSSAAFAIGQTTPLFAEGMPQITGFDPETVGITSATKQPATTYYSLVRLGSGAPTVDQIKAGQDATEQTAYSAGQVMHTQANTPAIRVADLLLPSTYILYAINEDAASGCLTDSLTTRSITTSGVLASYCTPVHRNPCQPGANISDFSLSGTTLSRLNSGCSENAYGILTNTAHRVKAGTSYSFKFRTYYDLTDTVNFTPQNIAIWIDFNKNGVFDLSERLFQSNVRDQRRILGTITLPDTLSPGLLRLRVRTQYDRDGPIADPCTSVRSGETEDYFLRVESTQLADLSLSMQLSNRVPAVGQPVRYTLTVVNDGPAITRATVITSLAPQPLLFQGNLPPGSLPAMLTWFIPQLNPGQHYPLNFNGVPTTEGHYITTAQVAYSSASDPDSFVNSGTADGQDDAISLDFRTQQAGSEVFASPNPSQRVLPTVASSQPSPATDKADLSLSAFVSNRAPATGQVIRLVLTIKNQGGLSATGIIVRDTLRGLQFVASTGSSMSVVSTNGLYTIIEGFVANLPADQTTTLTADVRVTGTGQLTNMAEIYAVDQPDPDSYPRLLTVPYDPGSEGEDDTVRIDLRTP